ncbi:unnamed protein product [Blepharisma stoltei]|uniref:Uncharacterized protein n=1 Tax=Blepharisma stoltei TaxID=1481888 RepID=A0AAU9ILJ2_9CILI|nr:unnamed protein product [Blepharisma stoltei]
MKNQSQIPHSLSPRMNPKRLLLLNSSKFDHKLPPISLTPGRRPKYLNNFEELKKMTDAFEENKLNHSITAKPIKIFKFDHKEIPPEQIPWSSNLMNWKSVLEEQKEFVVMLKKIELSNWVLKKTKQIK